MGNLLEVAVPIARVLCFRAEEAVGNGPLWSLEVVWGGHGLCYVCIQNRQRRLRPRITLTHDERCLRLEIEQVCSFESAAVKKATASQQK